jgi:pyrroloquinoline quinone (PQQ) biosynthesis protein C
MSNHLDGLPEDVVSQYEALRQIFLKELPDRWLSIASCSDQDRLSDELHRLSGVAGGFGCSEIDRLARLAEAHLLSGYESEHRSVMQALSVEVQKLALD